MNLSRCSLCFVQQGDNCRAPDVYCNDFCLITPLLQRDRLRLFCEERNFLTSALLNKLYMAFARAERKGPWSHQDVSSQDSGPIPEWMGDFIPYIIQVFFHDSYSHSLHGSRAGHTALCKITCSLAKDPSPLLFIKPKLSPGRLQNVNVCRLLLW